MQNSKRYCRLFEKSDKLIEEDILWEKGGKKMDNNQQMNQGMQGQGYQDPNQMAYAQQQAFQQAQQQAYAQQQAFQQMPNQQAYAQQAFQQMPNQQMYNEQQMYQGQVGVQKEKKTMSKGAKLGLILGLSIGIPVIALILVLCLIPKRGASTPEAAAEGFMKGWLNHNVSQMKKYSMPTKLEKDIKNRVAGTLDYYYLSEYINYYYEDSNGVVSMNTITDEIYDYDDVMDYNEDFAEEGIFLNIKEARCIEVRFTYRYGYSTDDDYEYLDVIKVGNRWYVIPYDVLYECF